ncbi:MAG: hypothetical protein COC19_01230 [SAR86 cluster bacterium]|uniref:diguanylate cyclase n=1 Tax=SAR86 cluster bacterium TaxID=2030880 RepID=A0A2A4MTL5_9GAMM|nr:MAG: hypothetical protein COC19_01230 [SAR86 cluster bacterium]
MRSDISKIDNRVYIEQIKGIYKQSTTAIISPIVIGAAYVSIFWGEADHTLLLIWLSCIVAVAILRIAPAIYFPKRKSDENIELWGRLHISLSLCGSLVWGVAFVAFASTEKHILNVIIVLFMTGICAISTSSYIGYLKSQLAYFLPAVVLGTVNLLLIGNNKDISLAIGMMIYISILLRNSNRTNRMIVDAIKLNFQFEDEIEKRKGVEKELLEFSRRDGLTGLFNRRHFDEMLLVELQRAQRSAHPLSLVLFDIDYFKKFNDTYGHVEGDHCLQEVSRVIQEAVQRPGDLTARYGGEEIVAILPNTNSKNAYAISTTILEKIRALKIPHLASNLQHCKFVTTSAGVATIIPTTDTKPSDLIKLADEALYHAKGAGRNRVCESL